MNSLPSKLSGDWLTANTQSKKTKKQKLNSEVKKHFEKIQFLAYVTWSLQIQANTAK